MEKLELLNGIGLFFLIIGLFLPVYNDIPFYYNIIGFFIDFKTWIDSLLNPYWPLYYRIGILLELVGIILYLVSLLFTITSLFKRKYTLLAGVSGILSSVFILLGLCLPTLQPFSKGARAWIGLNLKMKTIYSSLY